MRISPLNTSLTLALSGLILIGSFTDASAADRYWQPAPGEDPDIWNLTTENWFNSASGGTAFAWDNSGTDVAYLNGTARTISLQDDIRVVEIRRGGTAGTLTISSDNVGTPSAWRTLDLDGGVVYVQSGGGRNIVFSNLKIDGDFTAGVLSGNMGILGFSNVHFSNSTVTIQRGVRFGAGLMGARVVLDGGTLAADNGDVRIDYLAGTGNLSFVSSAHALKLTQSETSQVVGRLTNPDGRANTGFEKSGTGTLILRAATPETSTHEVHRVEVKGGALYTDGTFAYSASPFNVEDNATFGGTFTTPAQVVLKAAGSRLSAGLPTLDGANQLIHHTGTLTLQAGLLAEEGGLLQFFLDEDDGAGGLLQSQIVVTGGGVVLDGTVGVHLTGLGAGLLQEGVVYTLFDASGATSFANTATWEIASNTTGLEIASFGFGSGVDSQKFQVRFAPIPEPASLGFLVGGAGLLLLWRRRSS